MKHISSRGYCRVLLGVRIHFPPTGARRRGSKRDDQGKRRHSRSVSPCVYRRKPPRTHLLLSSLTGERRIGRHLAVSHTLTWSKAEVDGRGGKREQR